MSFSCCGKEGWKDWVEAEIRRTEVSSWFGTPMRVYQCERGRYHLSSRPPRTEEERKASRHV